jgi:hypothetical protein
MAKIGFYASVQKKVGPNTQTALLLGPFDTYDQAEGERYKATRLAEMVDPRAAFYAYGVSKVTSPDDEQLPAGKLEHLRDRIQS